MTDFPDNFDDQVPSPYAARLESPVDYVPQRVVSLVPGLTETLFDLGLGDRLIAITEYCSRPADKVKSLPTVGGTQHPNIEYIFELQPDLVLFSTEENRLEDAEMLQSADVPVWVTGPRTIFDVLNVLWNIMDVFDHPRMVPRVREIERAYDYTLAAARGSSLVRVFAPIARDPWQTFNAETYPHDVLRVCGGENVFADWQRANDERLPAGDPHIAGRDRRYPVLSWDAIIEAQPDVVLLSGDPAPFSETDAAAIRSLDIPAAHSGRIHLIDGALLTWQGTRVGYALRDLPTLLMSES